MVQPFVTWPVPRARIATAFKPWNTCAIFISEAARSPTSTFPKGELPRHSSRGIRAQYSSRRRLAADNGLAKPRRLRRGLERQTIPRRRLGRRQEAVLALDAPTDRGRAPGSFFVTSFRGLRPFGLTLGYILSSPTGTQGKTQSAKKEIREDRKERANLLL